MPIKNRIASFENEMISWRHHFHENPELAYDEKNIAKIGNDAVNLAYEEGLQAHALSIECRLNK